MYKNGAVLIGILVSLMVSLNGVLSSYINQNIALTLIYLIGLVTTVLFLLLQRKKLQLKNTPLHLFTGGVFGVFLVLFNNLTFRTIGVSLTIALGLLGQLSISLIIDHFGLFKRPKYKVKKEKIISLSLIILGILVMNFY